MLVIFAPNNLKTIFTFCVMARMEKFSWVKTKYLIVCAKRWQWYNYTKPWDLCLSTVLGRVALSK